MLHSTSHAINCLWLSKVHRGFSNRSYRKNQKLQQILWCQTFCIQPHVLQFIRNCGFICSWQMINKRGSSPLPLTGDTSGSAVTCVTLWMHWWIHRNSEKVFQMWQRTWTCLLGQQENGCVGWEKSSSNPVTGIDQQHMLRRECKISPTCTDTTLKYSLSNLWLKELLSQGWYFCGIFVDFSSITLHNFFLNPCKF